MKKPCNCRCQPYFEIDLELPTLDNAKKECSANPDCHMFFHQKGENDFYFCRKTARIVHSEKPNFFILYQRQGNKPYRQF